MDRTHSRRVTTSLLICMLAGTHASPLLAHEVPVHKALTDLAIDYLVQQRPELASCAEPEIRLQLKYGVDHEDDAPLSGLVPFGDFFFHFQPKLNDIVKPELPANVSVAASCSASDWLLGNDACDRKYDMSTDLYLQLPYQIPKQLSVQRTNEFGWAKVLPNLLAPAETAAKAAGVVGVGHFIHLLQDMTSPAHTRNDAHPHVPQDIWWLPPAVRALNDYSQYEVTNLGRFVASKAVGAPSIFPMPTAGLIDNFPPSFMTDLRDQTHKGAYSEKDLDRDLITGNGPAATLTVNGYILGPNSRPIARENPNPEGRRDVMIDSIVAAEQFNLLAPEAIRWTASLLNFVQTTHPVCETLLRVNAGGGRIVSSSNPARPSESILCGFLGEGQNNTCRLRFPSGTSVRLTAQRVLIPSELPGLPPIWDSGEFVGWVGACAGQGPDCEITIGDMFGGDPRTRVDTETIAVFERSDPSESLRGHPDTSTPPTLLAYSRDPIVNGNQVQLSGNWRLWHLSGDEDDFQMAIGTGFATRMTNNFSRVLYFGADGEHGALPTPGLPESDQVSGVIRFWIDDDPDFEKPTLLEVRPFAGEDGFFQIFLDDNEDHSRIDLILGLQRLDN